MSLNKLSSCNLLKVRENDIIQEKSLSCEKDIKNLNKLTPKNDIDVDFSNGFVINLIEKRKKKRNSYPKQISTTLIRKKSKLIKSPKYSKRSSKNTDHVLPKSPNQIDTQNKNTGVNSTDRIGINILNSTTPEKTREPIVSLYSILNVQSNSSLQTIKNSYRKAINQAHPDKGGNIDDFRKIRYAYWILSCSERKKFYDKFGLKALENFECIKSFLKSDKVYDSFEIESSSDGQFTKEKKDIKSIFKTEKQIQIRLATLIFDQFKRKKSFSIFDLPKLDLNLNEYNDFQLIINLCTKILFHENNSLDLIIFLNEDPSFQKKKLDYSNFQLNSQNTIKIYINPSNYSFKNIMRYLNRALMDKSSEIDREFHNLIFEINKNLDNQLNNHSELNDLGGTMCPEKTDFFDLFLRHVQSIDSKNNQISDNINLFTDYQGMQIIPFTLTEINSFSGNQLVDISALVAFKNVDNFLSLKSEISILCELEAKHSLLRDMSKEITTQKNRVQKILKKDEYSVILILPDEFIPYNDMDLYLSSSESYKEVIQKTDNEQQYFCGVPILAEKGFIISRFRRPDKKDLHFFCGAMILSLIQKYSASGMMCHDTEWSGAEL